MPTSRGSLYVWLWLMVALATQVAAAQQLASSDDAEALAKRAFALADAGKFDEVAPLLASLAQSHRTSSARYAAGLYASERAFAHGDRPRAASWLKPLAVNAPQGFRSAAVDAIAWCEVDPSDLKLPSARLLEMADQHAASSFAPVALQLRAEKLANAKQPDEAIFVYQGLLARFPSSRFAPVNMLAVARLHHELVQDREAWQWLEKLVNEHPDAPQVDAALHLGADVARGLKQDELSRQWLERLVTEHEASRYWADTACRLAELEITKGQRESARALIAKLLEQDGASAEIGQRAQFLLIRLSVADSDWKEVERHSQDLIAAKADEPLRTLALFWHAEAAYRRGQYEPAFTRFLDLSIGAQGHKDDWLGIVPLRLAQIEAQQQKWDVALERAELLAKERPQLSRMHEVDYLRGRCLAALARLSEAREMLAHVAVSDAALKTETAAMAQWMIGETYFQQKRYDEAIAAYERTLACDFPQWRAAALLQAAKCCEQLGRWSDAAARYETLIRDYGDTRYVAQARSRLAATQQRANIAAQKPSATETR